MKKQNTKQSLKQPATTKRNQETRIQNNKELLRRKSGYNQHASPSE
jgi:hypothetical protein